jgi:large subunit ribosomal protein L19
MVFSRSMDDQLLKKVEEPFVKRTPDIRPGDTVKVHLRIVEGGKERIQIFEGVVISVSGTGLGKTITVRKISYGIGVEKIFPLNTPSIKKIDVVERGDVRRSKLFYMRKAVGRRSLDAGVEEGFEGIEEKVTEEVAKGEAPEVAEGESETEVNVEEEEPKEEPAGTAPTDKEESSTAEPAPADEESSAKDEKKEEAPAEAKKDKDHKGAEHKDGGGKA